MLFVDLFGNDFVAELATLNLSLNGKNLVEFRSHQLAIRLKSRNLMVDYTFPYLSIICTHLT